MVFTNPHMKQRAKQKNSKFVLLGDNDEWILPKDPRFLSSKTPRELQGLDDYIDVAIDQQEEKLKEFDWLWISMGNHDYEMINRHATSPTARLARRLCCLYGGWSGFLTLKFRTKRGAKVWASITILYHHGASNAPVTKGLIWAQRFAAGWEDWDVFVFGHTHHLWCDHNTVGRRTERDTLKFRDRWIVNCGTWLQTYEEGGTPGYGERRGYKPVAIAAPQISVTPKRDNTVGLSVTMGNQ
jgi:hypothetical protein